MIVERRQRTLEGEPQFTTCKQVESRRESAINETNIWETKNR